MQWNQMRVGLKVRVARLSDVSGVDAEKEHLDARQEGVNGTVTKVASRRDPDHWLVEHENGKTAIYSFDELEAAA